MDSSAQLTPPRVEFYVLGSAAAQDRLRAACQLAGKGWRAGLPVFIRCTDDAQLTSLDELLWHFRGEAFIPHNRHADNPTAPVVLGLEETPEARQGLLINLHSQLCQHLQGFGQAGAGDKLYCFIFQRQLYKPAHTCIVFQQQNTWSGYVEHAQSSWCKAADSKVGSS